MITLRETIGTYWDRLSKEQIQLLSNACKQKRIVDLGAGNGGLSELLLQQGAKYATVVEYKAEPKSQKGQNWHLVTQTFEELTQTGTKLEADIAVVSWPINRPQPMWALVQLLKSIPEVVYAGTNRFPTQCGTSVLWGHLSQRNVVRHLVHQEFTTIHYGKVVAKQRELLEEEANGLGK